MGKEAEGLMGKEGSELVLKSAMRLGKGTEGEEWKLVKKKNGLNGSGKKVIRSAGGRKISSTLGIGEEPSGVTIRPESPSSSPSLSTSEELSTSPYALTTKAKLKLSKFHFNAEDYPSPPDSPPEESLDGFLPTSSIDDQPLPPVTPITKLRRLASNSSFQPTPPPNFNRLLSRRAESITSISTLPPDFFSSKSRITSSTGFSPKTITAPVFSTSGLANCTTIDNDVDSHRSHSKPEESVSWTSTFRKRLLSFRNNSKNTLTGLFVINKDDEAVGEEGRKKPSAAVEILQNVLLRDDLSAGPGMYWADSNEVECSDDEGLEGGEEEKITKPYRPKFVATISLSSTSSSKPPPVLRSTRSFFDPTTSSSSSIPIPPLPKRQVAFSTPPQLITTPPTPDKNAPLPSTSSSNQPSLHRSRSKSRGAGNGQVDPYLLELERKSRVGVKTKCWTCGKSGLNFPACPRCKETFCSRVCRVKVGKAGDGERHICPTHAGNGKGKGKEVV